MHPYFTPVWFLKFGIATVAAGIAAWNGHWLWAVVFFVSAIVTITALAHVLYAIIRSTNPRLVRRWEIDSSRRLLFSSEPEEVSRRLTSIDFVADTGPEAAGDVSRNEEKT